MDKNLTTRLGERILKAAHIEFKEVTHIDLNYSYSRGWSEYTPADSYYPVVVHYDGQSHEKDYDTMGPIIKELEDIADEIRDEAYK